MKWMDRLRIRLMSLLQLCHALHEEYTGNGLGFERLLLDGAAGRLPCCKLSTAAWVAFVAYWPEKVQTGDRPVSATPPRTRRH